VDFLTRLRYLIRLRPKRHGISEITATVLTMAITLIAGFAVFGYVNTQAGRSETQYGQAVGGTVQYLEERFVVAQFSFSPGAVSIYLYNNGRITLQIAQVELYDSAKSTTDVVFSAAGATDLLHSGCTVSTPSSVESPVLGSGVGSYSLATTAVLSLLLTLPTQSMNSRCPSAPSWTSGMAYYAKITGVNGNQVVYYQVN
jgi:flagellin-like protein